MAFHRIRHVVVIDDDKRPIGVVGIRAILKQLREMEGRSTSCATWLSSGARKVGQPRCPAHAPRYTLSPAARLCCQWPARILPGMRRALGPALLVSRP
ncbi:hypothetical protein [Hyphomonas sp.]|uniref:hypothetical protein n=1 Tax=Hyphomonas sp. TaxID=87 RepID=UPI0034A01653